MTGNSLRLNLSATTSEGTHDFIDMLEKVIDDIKGGVESHEYGENEDGRVIILEWKITPE